MRWLLLVLLGTCHFCVQAQPLGNEWIVKGQPYYKIPIGKSGYYALTHAHLQRAGINPTAIDPRTLQLIHRGRELAVQVNGEADGRFDTTDTLLFAGQPNDGIADSALYRPAAAQPHPFYSLFSDTTCYFLTWRAGERGLRESARGQSEAGLRLAESHVVLTTEYAAGVIYPFGATLATGSVLSHYDEGEGWTGPAVSAGQSASVVVPLTGVFWSDTTRLTLNAWVAGRHAAPHRVEWLVNGLSVGETLFGGYTTGRLAVSLSGRALGRPANLTITAVPRNAGESVSLSAVWVQYPSLAQSTPTVLPAPELVPVRFRVFEPGRASYLIITHPRLQQPAGSVRDPVQAYAAYRASPEGGRYDTLTVTIGELFDQFNYGERSPLAIRHFARFIHPPNSPKKAPLLFLIGQSRDPQGVRRNPDAARLDLVPNGGWPGSDVLLVSGLNGEPADVPALPVGRLNTDRPEAVLDYLAKVRQYEADSMPALWRKTLLHLSGGRSVDELNRFRGYLDGFSAVARRAPLGAIIQMRSKQTTDPVEAVPVADLVNEGVGVMTLFGHSGLDVTDIDIGLASDDRRGYRNAGRYPFLLVNGCAAGNIFFGRPTLGTDWVTTPGRGAIGFLAHTYNGFPDEMNAFTRAFYETLADPNWLSAPVGRLHQETILRYLRQNSGVVHQVNAQQFLLQGDPAVRLFPFTKPDYSFALPQALLQVPRSDSLLVRVGLTNAGNTLEGVQIPIRVRQYTPEGQLLHEQVLSVRATLSIDTVYIRIPRVTSASVVIELTLNPDNRLEEHNYANNRLVLGGNSSSLLPFPVDQVPPLLEVTVDGRMLQNGDYVSARPLITARVRDENERLLRRDTTGLMIYLRRPSQAQTGLFERLSWQRAPTASEENGLAFRVNYQPSEPWSDGLYQLEAYASDLSGNRAAPYRISFRIDGASAVTLTGAAPNPFGGSSAQASTRLFCTLTGAQSPETIDLFLFNEAGQRVRTAKLPGRIGTSEWTWDGTDAAGNRLPAGLYVYRFVLGGVDSFTNDQALTGRVLLLR